MAGIGGSFDRKCERDKADLRQRFTVRRTTAWSERVLETSTRETPFGPNSFSHFLSCVTASGFIWLGIMILIIQATGPPTLRAFSIGM